LQRKTLLQSHLDLYVNKNDAIVVWKILSVLADIRYVAVLTTSVTIIHGRTPLYVLDLLCARLLHHKYAEVTESSPTGHPSHHLLC
jgi:hypothetical protein